MLLGSTVFALIGMARDFRERSDITIPEGAIVYSIEAVGGPVDLYRDYREVPYATTPYPPLYYLGSSLMAQLCGADVESTYRGGRIVTVCASLASIGSLIFLTWCSSRSYVASFVAAGCVVLDPPLNKWFVTCRPDMLALSFTLLGFVSLYARRKHRDLAAVAAFSAAMCSKHSYVAGPIAIVVYFVIRGDAMRAMKMISGMFLTVGAAALICRWVFGKWFFVNIVSGNVAPIVVSQPSVFFLEFVSIGAVPLLLVVFGACANQWLLWRPWSLEFIYCITALAVATMTSLKAGADINYYIEPLFALSWLAGSLWPRAGRLRKTSMASRVLGLLVVVTLCEILFVRTNWSATLEPRMASVERITLRKTSRPRLVHEFPEPVLIGDAGLVMRAGVKPWILDKFNASYLGGRRRIVFTEIIEMVRRREFSAVISELPLEATLEGHPWWPVAVRRAVREHYPVVTIRGGYWVFKPRLGQVID